MFHKHDKCWEGINTVCKECRATVSKTSWSDKRLTVKILQRTKSRAKLRGLDFNLTEEDIVIPDRCPILLTPFEYGSNDTAPSIDRIDPSLGYVRGNIEIISNKANRMKSDATYDELILFAKWVYEL